MNEIKFTLNEPQILKLSDPTGDLDGANVVYPTEDGKILTLPRHAAGKLNSLFLEAGEEVSITRYRKTPSEPAEWVICLTPRSEKTRAQKENPEIERQLSESLREFPHKKATPAPKGTGTYGPSPVLSPRIAGKQAQGGPPGRVSYRVALREITESVLELLSERKEQWESDPRQGLISTCFIAAAKANTIIWDFQPEADAK